MKQRSQNIRWDVAVGKRLARLGRKLYYTDRRLFVDAVCGNLWQEKDECCEDGNERGQIQALVYAELSDIIQQIRSHDARASRTDVKKLHLFSVVPVEAAITYIKYFFENVTCFFDRETIFLRNFTK